METVDFTSCPRVPGRAYNGANGKKIAVSFASRADPGLVEALDRLLPRIRLLDFGSLLAETPYLSDLQRSFLLVYLNARRDKLFG